MLKKTFLSFVFLTVLTSIYGFDADYAVPAARIAPAADDHSLLADGEYRISTYDNIIRSVSERAGNDWRLVSAIAYHESRFDPAAVSCLGARGLMQIMPVVARHFDVPVEQISDPATNVWLANKLLTQIDSMLQLPAEISSHDRMSLVLASYNGGVGHVRDARRLASYYGEDPNSWEVVARYLELKSDPTYYKNDVVQNGRFTGGQRTSAYVRDVIGRYDRYCRTVER